MTMQRSAFPKSLKPGLHAQFGLEYARYPDEWRDIFEVAQADKAVEEEVLLSGLGYAQTKNEGSAYANDDGIELWTARYDIETIGLGFNITEEMVEDNLYGSLGARMSKSMARSFKMTKNLKGANVLNNGFTAGATAGGDGVALFSTAHPLRNGGTLSNRLATDADLSETSYEDMTNLIFRFKDDRGLPCMVKPKALVVNRGYLTQTATRIAMSPMRPGTADNDINASRQMGLIDKVVPLTDLTDADAWFIITDSPDGLKYMDRIKLSTKTEGDFPTGNLRFKGRERYKFGFSDPRGAAGTSGA